MERLPDNLTDWVTNDKIMITAKGQTMRHRTLAYTKGIKFIRWHFLLAFFFLTLICVRSSFAIEFSTFAGGEIDGRGQGFSYFGIDLTQPITKTFAISGRVVPNYLVYKYYSGNTEIRATSPGLTTVAGVKFTWDKTTLGIFGGADFRNTTLSPDDQFASVRGATSGGVIQGEFDHWFPTKTNLGVYGSYSGTSDFSYEKARIKQQVSNLDYKGPTSILVGVDQTYGRNADFHGITVGPMAELYYIPWKFSIAVRGGYKHDSTFGGGGYGGLELYKGF